MQDYYPDLIANDSIAFLRASKRRQARKPVLLVMSFPAPHGPEDSAPQYSHLFFNVTTHQTLTEYVLIEKEKILVPCRVLAPFKVVSLYLKMWLQKTFTSKATKRGTMP
ncbi:Extracellular sulfatase SULF-1 homolog [Eumeta japonica]|uniref:Extracellular sulfatase SULF-1 homolog n=1 Tax=Eumeta variegata TaxID=151549 RepID=A0A4C2A322_EUMVA|nr:Extracellular sulfatase SULF-1 homolog [Eumeta japonica]